MRLRQPTWDDVVYIARNMRARDRREIFATRWDDDPATLAQECLRMSAFGWVAAQERPIAWAGAYPLHPGVWTVFCFATDEFPQIRISLTRFIKRVMIPSLLRTGAHRAECQSMAEHTEAHKWLEALGATHEATLRGHGRNGETFFQFSWIADHVHEPQNAGGQLR